MGIPGLTTSIYGMPEVWESDDAAIPIVIDGHAMIHFVAQKMQRREVHSYRKFAEGLRLFLDAVGHSRIKMVLFDGSAPASKFPTELSRLRQRRSTARKMMQHIVAGTISQMNTYVAEHLIMPFTEEAAFAVLRELSIPFQVCWREADQQVAKLAHEIDCAVMSRDSDFFLYELSGGYIPLDRWESDRSTCRFRFQLLVQSLAMTVEDILSLPCFMGNDETPKGRSFEAAIRAIKLRTAPDFPGYTYPRPIKFTEHPALPRVAQGEYHPWLIDAEMNRTIVPTVMVEDENNPSWSLTQPIRSHSYFVAFFGSEPKPQPRVEVQTSAEGKDVPPPSADPASLSEVDEARAQVEAALAMFRNPVENCGEAVTHQSQEGLTEMIAGRQCFVVPKIEDTFSPWVTLDQESLFVTLVRHILPNIDEYSCKALILGFSGVALPKKVLKGSPKKVKRSKLKLARIAVNDYALWQALLASVRMLLHASSVSSGILKPMWDMDDFFSIRSALLSRQRLVFTHPQHVHLLQQKIFADLKPEWIPSEQEMKTEAPKASAQKSNPSSSTLPSPKDEIDTIMAFINAEDLSRKTPKKKRSRVS